MVYSKKKQTFKLNNESQSEYGSNVISPVSATTNYFL